MRVLAVFFFIALTCVITSGCIAGGTDRIVGTWEWSDGKGYVERYSFNEDHSFQAEALGSEFSGTWKMITPGHYEVRYMKVNDSAGSETLIESVLYDERSDAIYFPAHRRVT